MKNISLKNNYMLDISPTSASLIHTIASATAIVAALISASAVILAHMAAEVQNRHAESSIEAATQATQNAKDAAAQSKLQIVALTQQNLELSTKLEAEITERLKVASTLKPRKLTPEALAAFTALAAELSEKKTTPTVLINVTRNDDEILQFSKQIAVALTKAGVQVQIKKLTSMKDITGTQVVLYSGPGDQALERAFRNTHLDFQILRSSKHPRVNIQDQDSQDITAFISVYPKGLSQ